MRVSLFLLLFSFSAHALAINEIMYDPVQDDSFNEWAEIYNNESTTISVENFTICGSQLEKGFINATNSTIQNDVTFELQPGEYAVVTDGGSGTNAYDNFNISGIAFHTSASSICTGLSNSGDEIFVEGNSLVYDNISYSDMVSEGKSLCRNGSSFYECDPTPGRANVQPSGPSEACDVSISIEAPDIYNSTYDIVLVDSTCLDKNVSVEYWIGDLFGNVEKDPVVTNQTFSCSKTVGRSWQPGNIIGSEAYIIFARTESVSCNDTDQANNNASKIIVVKGNVSSQTNDSSITILGTEDVKFGEAAIIELDVYRGDTAKYLIDVYARNQVGSKVSYVSKLHAKLKYTSYRFSIPLQIKSNCGGDFVDDNYTVVVEGLDKLAESSMNIAGASSNCKTVTISSSEGSSSGGGIALSNSAGKYSVTYPETISVGDEFDIIVRFNATSKKTYSLYSYVYRGNTPVSEGFDGASWKGTWTANERKIDAEPGNTYVVALRSRIEEETQPGIYNLRVKIKSDREEEVTKEIDVRKKEAVSGANESLNDTSVKQVPKISAAVTGMALKKSRAHEILPLLSAILRVKKFF